MIASTTKNMVDQVNLLTDNEVENIHIVPFGIDLNVFKYRPEFQPLDRIVIGTVKSLKKIYELHILIESFNEMLNSLESEGQHDLKSMLVLEIYGSGPELNSLQEVVQHFGLDNQVLFKGTVANNDVPKALNDFALFISTSKSESFGVSIIEAMACGVPVIATDTLGAREIIQDGVNGFLVDVGDTTSISNKMKLLLSDRELYSEIRSEARELVEQRYSFVKNVEEMISLYEYVVKVD